MSKLTELDDASFRGFVESNDVAVVDFYADWCMPCKLMGPVVEGLAADLDGSVGFAKINIDRAQRTASAFGVMSIPTLLVFRNGRVVDKLVGLRPKNHIAAIIEKQMS